MFVLSYHTSVLNAIPFFMLILLSESPAVLCHLLPDTASLPPHLHRRGKKLPRRKMTDIFSCLKVQSAAVPADQNGSAPQTSMRLSPEPSSLSDSSYLTRYRTQSRQETRTANPSAPASPLMNRLHSKYKQAGPDRKRVG